MRDNTATKPVSTRGKLIGEIIAEIKKVTWLSRREILNLTIMVLVVTITVALILGGIDYGFSFFIQYFISR
jgi:preprotein translocase subunit SecE